jgi:hypothetical protein
MASSSMFGIILGGLIKGIEKDGFVTIDGPFLLIYIFTVSNLEHSLVLIGKGSNKKSFFS